MRTELTLTIVFWASFAAVAYVYFGYPAALAVGLIGSRKPVARDGAQPTVSVIVAARNEESTIAEKLANLIDSDYPRERVEIFVGSDGSSDRTEEIVRQLGAEGVTLISFPEHHGKSAIQNRLVSMASGEILLFTDADCFVRSEAIRLVAENFSDSQVGLVTACVRYEDSDETGIGQNEGLYIRYDTWLRECESARGILAMASGSFFAMRRSLWAPVDPDLGDDFLLPLEIVRRGMRNVIDMRVTAVTRLAHNDIRAMLGMRTRVVSRDFRALLKRAKLLDPIKHSGVAVALWSHKLLRWFVPYFLLASFASNLLLVDRPFFRAAFELQAVFYALALAGFLAPKRRKHFLLATPMSFCLANFAALAGTLRCIAGRTSGKWTPERARIAPISAVPEATRDRGIP